MVGQPGSLYIIGVLHWMIALTCSVRKTFLSTFNPLFTMHRSFKNIAYVGTCLIMISRGMLTFTCLSTSNISAWLMWGCALFHCIFFYRHLLWFIFFCLLAFFCWFGDWLFNLLTTPQSDNCFNFIYPGIWLARRAYFMHPP